MQGPEAPEQPSGADATELALRILHGTAGCSTPEADGREEADEGGAVTPRIANIGVTGMSGAGGLWQGSAQLPPFPRPPALLELDSAPPSVQQGFAALARRKKAALLARNPALQALQVSGDFSMHFSLRTDFSPDNDRASSCECLV